MPTASGVPSRRADIQQWIGAARTDKLGLAEALLRRHGPQLLDVRAQSIGNTALHWAAAKNHERMLVWLLDSGADISPRNASGYTPIHVAAANGAAASVAVLLSRGADASQPDGAGCSAVQLAGARGDGRNGAAEVLAAWAAGQVGGQRGGTAARPPAVPEHSTRPPWATVSDSGLRPWDIPVASERDAATASEVLSPLQQQQQQQRIAELERALVDQTAAAERWRSRAASGAEAVAATVLVSVLERTTEGAAWIAWGARRRLRKGRAAPATAAEAQEARMMAAVAGPPARAAGLPSGEVPAYALEISNLRRALEAHAAQVMCAPCSPPLLCVKECMAELGEEEPGGGAGWRMTCVAITGVSTARHVGAKTHASGMDGALHWGCLLLMRAWRLVGGHPAQCAGRRDSSSRGGAGTGVAAAEGTAGGARGDVCRGRGGEAAWGRPGSGPRSPPRGGN
jgi:hypothetical protein